MKRLFVIVCCMSVLLQAAPATAEDAAKLARAAFEEGKALFEAGEYTRAADAFRRADAARPNWKLLYNIGQCEAAARRYGLALDAFESYLVQGGDEIDRERQDEVRGELVRLRDLVGFARVTAPEGAVVVMDGVTRGTAPLGRDLPVAAAVSHEASAVVAGETVAQRAFQVSGGRTVEVDLVAERAASSEPADVKEHPGDQAGSGPEKSLLRPLGFVGVGLGAALLVGGGVTGGLALKKDGELEDDCLEGICYSGSYDLMDQRDRMATASTALFVAGGVVAAAGVVMLILDAARGEGGATEVDVSLLLGPGNVALSGRF